MSGLILLASGVLFPLLALAFISSTRENIPLMLRLLSGTGVVCGGLAWLPFLLPYLGIFASVRTVAAPLGAGFTSVYEIFVSLADTASLIASALVAGAWILALFEAVRERNSKWIRVLVVGGIIAYLARVIYQDAALTFLFGTDLYLPNSVVLTTGLYALTLLGGITAFLYGSYGSYGSRRATPSGHSQDAQAALDDDAVSTITREPL